MNPVVKDKIKRLTDRMNQAKMLGKVEEVKMYKKAIKTLEFWD